MPARPSRKEQMKNANINTKKGFTIIEVVLVLAIAGLIFLMVFVALPSLQSSQRDTTRKNNYSLIGTAVENYKSAHGGKLPSDWASIAAYIDSNIQDPEFGTINGAVTNIAAGTNATYNTYASATGRHVQIVKEASCNKDTDRVVSANPRNYAIVGYLESGYYCESH